MRKIFKADEVLRKFEKSLEALRTFKDESNSSRIQFVLESLKDFQTSKEIDEEDI